MLSLLTAHNPNDNAANDFIMRMDQITSLSNMKRNTDYDVMCGKHSFSNPGNEYFRKLVQMYRKIYRSTNIREEKRRIIHHIIEQIHRQGGRFLKSETEKEEIPFPVQYEKVSHALRSARAPVAALVRTRAELAGNVNTLLEKQRQLYQQYCHDANVESFTPHSASSSTSTFSNNPTSDQQQQIALPEPVLSKSQSLSLDKISLGLILSAFDAQAAMQQSR